MYHERRGHGRYDCAKMEVGCLAAKPVMLQSLIQLLPSPPKLTLMGVVDILVVAFLIYELILIVRGTRAAHILLGILTIVLIYNLSMWLRFDLLHSILSHAMPYMAVAIAESRVSRLAKRSRAVLTLVAAVGRKYPPSRSKPSCPRTVRVVRKSRRTAPPR